MRTLAVLLSLTAALLVAQASSTKRKSSRGSSDAGPLMLGPDPPGKLRPDPPARDGGTAAAAVSSDAGTTDATQVQLLQLRARIDTLELQVTAAQQQAQQMQAINDQLQALRQQLAAADAERQAQQQQAQARREAVQSALTSLSGAQQQLAIGDAAIGDALDQAQAAFSGQAQRDVQAARYALQNGDLAAARAYLNTAVADAQQGH